MKQFPISGLWVFLSAETAAFNNTLPNFTDYALSAAAQFMHAK